MKNYNNTFRINEHQIYTEINGEQIIVSDLDEPTKDVFFELESQPMGTYEQWLEYEKSKINNIGDYQSLQQIREIETWFTWYDNQVSQAERAQRQGKTWFAVYAPTGERYVTVKQLDDEADAKQLEMSNLVKSRVE